MIAVGVKERKDSTRWRTLLKSRMLSGFHPSSAIRLGVFTSPSREGHGIVIGEDAGVPPPGLAIADSVDIGVRRLEKFLARNVV